MLKILLRLQSSHIKKLVGGFFLCNCIVLASTDVSGTISSNETWTSTGNPYIVTASVTVNSGVTLTINPDVIIKFNNQTGIQVKGHLEVNGTEGHEVYFTAYTDDSVGGDTNDDNTTTTPNAGYWGGIDVIDNASADIRHTVIRYGGNWWPFLFYTTL